MSDVAVINIPLIILIGGSVLSVAVYWKTHYAFRDAALAEKQDVRTRMQNIFL